jgi:uncharacterized membrane protein YraQ (UPF0718 family)/YHS domain-containing protein
LTPRLIEVARTQAERGVAGKMEGHAGMDMSVGEGSLFSRLASSRGITATSHYFVMDWVSVWQDVLLGFVIAGALAAWVPDSFWRNFFLADHSTLARIEGPLVGPLVAMISFVCSVGNVPLAAVLWRGGISFGGVVSFIFADLIVLPIIDIYRRYYTLKVALYITAAFYVAMAAAGYVVELLFAALGIVPSDRSVGAIGDDPTLNYTSILNVIFLILAMLLVARFVRTGGMAMLRSMNASPALGQGTEGTARDPVCGMAVDRSGAPRSEFGDASYYFCSEGDKRTFDANPDRFATGGQPGGSSDEHDHGR